MSINLRIRLRHYSDDLFRIEMERWQKDSVVTITPVRVDDDCFVALGDDSLVREAAIRHDVVATGRALGSLLFGDKRVHNAFRQATLDASQQPAGQQALHVQLDLDPKLQDLPWEALRDPDGNPIATSERWTLSRFLAAREQRTIRRTAPEAVRVAAAIAAPVGLATVGLAIPESENLVARLQESFGAASVERRDATLAGFRNALRSAYDVLFLAAHGNVNLVRDAATGQALSLVSVWLRDEMDRGAAKKVEVWRLVESFHNIDPVPALVILFSCMSGGTGEFAGGEDALALLGPQIISQGVPAVICMNGNVSFDSADRFLQRLLQSLVANGRIDLAMAAARQEIEDQSDAWAPILFTSMREGRLWPGDERLGQFLGHTYHINMLALHADGGLLASCGGDQRAIVWDVSAYENVRSLKHDRWVGAVAFVPGSELLATTDGNGVLRLWLWPAGELMRKIAAHEGAATALAVFGDGKTIVTGGADGLIRLWDTAQLELRKSLDGHKGAARRIILGPDDDTMISIGDDGLVFRWSMPSGTGRLLIEEPNTIWRSVAYAPSGKAIALTDGSGDVLVWSLETNRVLWRERAHRGAAIGVCIRPDGRVLATGGQDGLIRLWEAASGKTLGALTGHSDFVTSLVYSSDGTRLYSASRDKTIRVWLPGNVV